MTIVGIPTRISRITIRTGTTTGIRTEICIMIFETETIATAETGVVVMTDDMIITTTTAGLAGSHEGDEKKWKYMVLK